MWQDYEKDFSRVSHMTPNFHIAYFLPTYISTIRLYGIF